MSEQGRAGAPGIVEKTPAGTSAPAVVGGGRRLTLLLLAFATAPSSAPAGTAGNEAVAGLPLGLPVIGRAAAAVRT